MAFINSHWEWIKGNYGWVIPPRCTHPDAYKLIVEITRDPTMPAVGGKLAKAALGKRLVEEGLADLEDLEMLSNMHTWSENMFDTTLARAPPPRPCPETDPPASALPDPPPPPPPYPPEADVAPIAEPMATRDDLNTEHPPPDHAPPHKATWICATWNAMGLYTTSEELGNIVRDIRPHLIVVTETKHKQGPRTGGLRREVQQSLTGYATYASGTREGGRAGLIVAASMELATAGQRPPRHVKLPTALMGYVCHVQFDRLGSDKPAHVIGVYVPGCGEDAETTAEDMVEYICKTNRTAMDKGEPVIVVGDLNGNFNTGKASTTWAAKACRRLKEIGFEQAHDGPDGSEGNATYIGPTSTSFIDDVLVSAPYPAGRPRHWKTQAGIVNTVSDHAMLVVQMDSSALQWHIPPPREEQGEDAAPGTVTKDPRFVTPMKKDQLEKYKLRAEVELGHIAEKIEADIKAHRLYDRRQARAADRQTKVNEVDAMARRIDEVLYDGLRIAMAECDMIEESGGKAHLPKVPNKKLKDLLHRRKETQRARNMAANMAEIDDVHPGLETITHPEVPKEPRQGETLQDWKDSLQGLSTTTNKEIRNLLRREKKRRYKRGRQAWQKRYWNNQRRQNCEALKGTQPARMAPMIIHPEKGVVSATEDIVDAFTMETTSLMSPAIGFSKQGKWEKTERPQHPFTPGGTWKGETPPDQFTPRCPRGQPGCARTLDDKITSVLYEDCVKELSYRKATGPDSIPNELLKHLPDAVHGALQAFFRMMWRCAHTPDWWKESDTIFLYKKGDPALYRNYRPIGLANHVYKLWTSVITMVSADHAEENNILSGCQAGFRAKMDTMRQVRTLINALEDSNVYKQDIMVAYIDFTSAFNTTEHDMMLQFMWDLGFTEDTVEVIKDLYTNAVTRVVIQGQRGPDIPINRGTIQGDSLSPFLFLVYIEYLLRWLQVGGRDYQYGCVQDKEVTDAAETMGSGIPDEQRDRQSGAGPSAYADDLLIITGQGNARGNMKTQLRKVEIFSEYAGIKPNVVKCMITGMAYGNIGNGVSVQRLAMDTIQMRLRGMTMGGEHIPVLAPDKPYKYLGVQVTATLDWQHQRMETEKALMEKKTNLLKSRADETQRMHMLKTSIIPALTYGFCVTAYTPAQLRSLCSKVLTIAKECYGLQKGTPNAAVQLPVDEGGLDVPSLMTQYAALAAKDLIKCLSDPGQLGMVTKCLLLKQSKHMVLNMPLDVTWSLARNSTVLKQLAVIRLGGYRLVFQAGGEEYQPVQTSLVTALLDNVDIAMQQVAADGSRPSRDVLIQTYVLPLLQLEMYKWKDIQKTRGKLVSAVELKTKCWPRDISDRHRRALNFHSRLFSGDTTSVLVGEITTDSLPEERRWVTRRGAADYDFDEGGKREPNLDSWVVQPAPKRPRHEMAQAPPCPEAAPPAQPHPDPPPPPGDETTQSGTPPAVQSKKPVRKGKKKGGQQKKPKVSREPKLCPQANPVEILAETEKPLDDGRKEYRYLVRWEAEEGNKAYIAKWEKIGYVLVEKTPIPERPGYFTIQWADRWEPSKVFEGEWTTVLQEYRAKRKSTEDTTGSPRPRPEHTLQDVDRTGAREWRTPKSIDQARTKISQTAVNPDSTIHAPGRFLLLQGPRPGQEDRQNAVEVVRCYRPDGSLAGTLRPSRADQLWRRWCAARAPGLEKDPQEFARDVAHLLARYGGDIRNHWATFVALMDAFRAVGIYTERFASPLNVHEDTRLYYSAYAEDALFGAVHDAYSAAFLTPSQINPEYTPEQLAKALKHAVQSTYLPEPQLHILVYPVWQAEPYKKWLAHPRVHRLCRIPRGQFSFIPYDHHVGVDRRASMNWAKWDVDLLLVANPGGIERWYDHDALAPAIRAAVGDDSLVVHAPDMDMRGNQETRPKGLAKSVRCYDAGTLGDLKSGPQHRAQHALPEPPPREVVRFDTSMLRYDYRNFMYTDGSKLEEKDGDSTRTGLGAAVVDLTRDKVVYVDPVALDGVNKTINRAEMAALYVALMEGRDKAELNILTDSQVSIRWILNEIHRPMRTAKLMHREIVRAVVDLIMTRDKEGRSTFIGKVKAHAGVRGNDLADAAAKLQVTRASGIETTVPSYLTRVLRNMDDDEVTVEVGKHIPIDGPGALLDMQAPGGQPRRVTPAQAAEDMKRRLRTWGSNEETAHFRMLQEMNDPQQKRLRAQSSRYMTSQGFVHSERRIIKKLMYGVFQTQKRDHMMRPDIFPSPQCVLCQGRRPDAATRRILDSDGIGDDGCGHVMGGCTHRVLSACYIKRHNEAVAAIARAVANGSRGRWLQVADLRKECLGEMSEEQQQLVASRIPAYMLPKVPDNERLKMRPDIMFVDGMEEGWKAEEVTTTRLRSMKRRCTVYILEVGYCRDNAALRKRAEKKRQHALLREALRKEGWQVEDVPIALGHCGSVYGHELDVLHKKLGVAKQDVLKLMKWLHEHAVKSTCGVARLYQQLRSERNKELGYVWRPRRKEWKGGAPPGGPAWRPP
jgi:ribonuclease HI